MSKSLVRRSRRPSWMTPFGHEGWGDVFSDRLWPEWRRDLGEEWTPTIDFYEKDGKYHLTAEIPGTTKDDVTVSIHDGIITVSGKRETNKEEEGADFYMKETHRGNFGRSFRLPGEVDEDKVDASFKDGVLTVVMPQKEASEKKKITIQ